MERGLEALQQERWQEAANALGRTDPSDDVAVAQLARALESETISVPGGTLQMGSEESVASDQKPVHPVEIAPYSLDRFEVTNVQYQRFVSETGHSAPRDWNMGHFPKGEAMQPVTGVTWEDARAYALRVGKRLPTEAEWEWAARGAEGRLYPWGNESDSTRANSQETGAGRSNDVGSYPSGATPEGIMDLAGNVSEWTADYHGPYQLRHQPPTVGEFIAVRGSSWNSYNDVASARAKVPPDTASTDLGFRCAR